MNVFNKVYVLWKPEMTDVDIKLLNLLFILLRFLKFWCDVSID